MRGKRYLGPFLPLAGMSERWSEDYPMLRSVKECSSWNRIAGVGHGPNCRQGFEADDGGRKSIELTQSAPGQMAIYFGIDASETDGFKKNPILAKESAGELQ